MPIRSPFADVEIPNKDLWTHLLDNPKREYPDNHTLFIDGESGRSYTYNDVRDLSTQFGQGLIHNFAWQKGDVLAFFTLNSIDTPVVNLGLHWAAGVASPANPTYTVEELARQLKDAGAKALVTQTPFLDASRRAAKLAGLPEDRIILLGEGRDSRFQYWRDITAEKAWFKPKKPSIDPSKDLAYLVYSSGTTGLPKGVMLYHSNIVANTVQTYRFDPRGLTWDADVQLGVLPFFHIYGLSVVINVSLLTGTKCVIMPRWDLEKACALIERHRITIAYVAPPIVLALSKSPLIDKYDLRSLKWVNSGAAPCSRELTDAVWSRLKVGVKQGYGLSETSPTTHTQTSDEWSRFHGSVGKMVTNMTAMIVDPDGKEVPEGEAGELLVKGPNVFPGYWNRPDLQKDTFTEDGWFKTGDVGYVDKHGNFFITDRIKELIKYKGFQVAPAELEAKLIGRQDIDDVCVIGVWDDKEHTEVPRAYVVTKPGVKGSEDLAKEIADWVAASVAHPKKLRGGVRFIDSIPKSASGKILRRVLKDQLKKDEAAVKAKL
ncbi:hypothetical protein N3K66_007658 [Trichothecium roseum]|uniref:Uncharacterized protein n=1 Tax=Trichothecium roseum TaxID=47278 RepID=A0ACC0UV41_9HYPO|nr:hypothetical protein N3K66_007658 [Trichothecium roseum]